MTTLVLVALLLLLTAYAAWARAELRQERRLLDAVVRQRDLAIACAEHLGRQARAAHARERALVAAIAVQQPVRGEA